MSVSSGIQATEELTQTLVEMRKTTSPVQVLMVQIDNNSLVQVKVQEGSPTKDLKVLSSLAQTNAAAYFLLRITASKWACVIYIPEEVSKVKERMLYASTHQALKAAFGHEYIAEDIQVGSKDEIFGKQLAHESPASRDNEELLSASEKNVREAIRQENIARKEQDTSMRKAGDIGGYHQVAMPFTEEADAAVASFKEGEVNWVELSISQDQKSIESKATSTITEDELSSKINTNEPRYYLYKFGLKTLFIYCCPSTSQTKPRMVYSTTKPSVQSRITQLGIEVDKKLEYSDVSDFTVANLNEELNPRKVYGGHSASSPTQQKKPVNVVGSSHPVYGLMNQSIGGPKVLNQRSEFQSGVINTGKKKIVLPPSVAYQ